MASFIRYHFRVKPVNKATPGNSKHGRVPQRKKQSTQNAAIEVTASHGCRSIYRGTYQRNCSDFQIQSVLSEYAIFYQLLKLLVFVYLQNPI